jgi:MoaA/NifB/PqqE/SkfB family radical SAM enzyme
MKLAILFRGPLSSCNYGCEYCPFAKRHETDAELEGDRAALTRFVAWVRSSPHQLSVFFTPWGEALIRRWYRDAVCHLSRLPNVVRVAAQTNLSMPLGWLEDADASKVALWSTYHPNETTRARFLAQLATLQRLGIATSVGVVGLREHFDEIHALRAVLAPETYLWVNAYKRVANYYTPAELSWLTSLDPLFPYNATRHASAGAACRTGEGVFSVDGDGTMRRCHFVAAPIGNVYEPDWERALLPRPCPNATCGCHIGYVHMERLALDAVFGEGILERIPVAVRPSAVTVI